MYTATIIIFILTYLLISATSRINKSLAVTIAACVVVFLNVVPFNTLLETVDLNVIFMVIGMMIFGDIVSQTGLFEWIAIMIARKTKGNGLMTVAGLLIAVAFCSALFNNVSALILFVPVTILLAQILRLPIRPLLILTALFANLGGTATLIGDPCNFIVGSRANIGFMPFLWHLTPAVIIIGFCWLCMIAVTRGRIFTSGAGAQQQIMKALPEKAITDTGMLWRILLMGILILAGLAASSYTGTPPGVIVLFGAIITGLICKQQMGQLLQKVDWPSIMFYGGLFIIIGSLELQGGFDDIVKFLLNFADGNKFLMAMIILWGCAFFSSVVDNIPLAIAMAPLVQKISLSFPDDPNHSLIWALVLGITLGGSISLFGTNSNYAMNRLAERSKYKIGIINFTAYGIPFAITGLLIASGYLYLRYFMK